MKKVIMILIALLVLVSGCGKGSAGGDVPTAKSSYANVDEYNTVYSGYIVKFTAYMKKALAADPKIADKATAMKWMKTYTAIQNKGFAYKDDDKIKLQNALMAVMNKVKFMKYFMPFNKALYAK